MCGLSLSAHHSEGLVVCRGPLTFNLKKVQMEMLPWCVCVCVFQEIDAGLMIFLPLGLFGSEEGV